MAIREYKSETGESLWKAYVCVRSKHNASIRVQRTKFGCKTEKQAEREEMQLIKQCQLEVLSREAQGDSWGAVVEAWERHLTSAIGQRLNEDTRDDYVAALRKHTILWWKRPAAGISRIDVQELINQLKVEGCSNSFLSKKKNMLNRVFIFGIERNLIRGMERSPALGIKIQRLEEKKPEILTLDQIKTLLASARKVQSPWYAIWLTALLTGMRSGELYALLWSDVDWENKQLSVTKSYNCRKRIVKSTKSGDWRTVPISQELLTLLKELKSTAEGRSSVLPRLSGWTHGYQASALREFCLGVGLPSIRFHTLRACFATQLIRSGIAPIRIQKICGWKDLETMQRYIRLAGIEIEGATEGLRLLPDNDVMEQASTVVTGTNTKA